MSDGEIRKIRYGYHMPAFKIQHQQRNSKVIYKIKKGYRTIWQLGKTDEFLEVYESYVGQKYLESYLTQYVSTSVSWVHCEEQEYVYTSLNYFDFNSWECDTLEPYTYIATIDGVKKEIVSNYLIPAGEKFGEHDFKITYKSPKSGKILEVEYPIYHLKEVSLTLDSTHYEWYPFRNLFAQHKYDCLPTSVLLFQCRDKKNNLISYDENIELFYYEAKYTFPATPNAKYKFGENQPVEMEYISSHTHKSYLKTISISIRKYYDERNPHNSKRNKEKIYSNSAKIYDYKDLKPTKITIDFKKTNYVSTSNAIPSTNSKDTKQVGANLRVLDLTNIKDDGSTNDYWISSLNNGTIQCQNENDIYSENNVHLLKIGNFFGINPTFSNDTTLTNMETFNSETELFNYLCNCSVTKETTIDGVTTQSQSYVLDRKTRNGVFLDFAHTNLSITSDRTRVYSCSVFESFSENYRNSKLEYEPFSGYAGYVYWGDDTFDLFTYSNCVSNIYCDTVPNSYCRQLTNEFNDKYSVVGTRYIKLANGYKLQKSAYDTYSTRVINYEDELAFKQRHNYDKDGVYTIEITASESYVEDYDYRVPNNNEPFSITKTMISKCPNQFIVNPYEANSRGSLETKSTIEYVQSKNLTGEHIPKLGLGNFNTILNSYSNADAEIGESSKNPKIVPLKKVQCADLYSLKSISEDWDYFNVSDFITEIDMGDTYYFNCERKYNDKNNIINSELPYIVPYLKQEVSYPNLKKYTIRTTNLIDDTINTKSQENGYTTNLDLVASAQKYTYGFNYNSHSITDLIIDTDKERLIKMVENEFIKVNCAEEQYDYHYELGEYEQAYNPVTGELSPHSFETVTYNRIIPKKKNISIGWCLPNYRNLMFNSSKNESGVHFNPYSSFNFQEFLNGNNYVDFTQINYVEDAVINSSHEPNIPHIEISGIHSTNQLSTPNNEKTKIHLKDNTCITSEELTIPITYNEIIPYTLNNYNCY